MSSALRSLSSKPITPEEFTSYQNIEDTFPPVYEEGKQLLALVAGKIQIMRLETEIFPQLLVEDNKALIQQNERDYIELEHKVAHFREKLQSINGQIERSINLNNKVPNSDIRSFEYLHTTTKVYDFCRQALPTLQDWYVQGTLLDKRFDLVLNKDPKHYHDSMTKFSEIIKPSTGIFSAFTSTFSQLWGYATEASAAPAHASPVKVDDNSWKTAHALSFISPGILEKLQLEDELSEFNSKLDKDGSIKAAHYQEKVQLFKSLLSKIVNKDSLQTLDDIQTTITELHKKILAKLIQHIIAQAPDSLSTILEDKTVKEALIHIDSRIQGAKATTQNLRDCLRQLLNNDMAIYNKPSKDPLKTELLHHLLIVANKI